MFMLTIFLVFRASGDFLESTQVNESGQEKELNGSKKVGQK